MLFDTGASISIIDNRKLFKFTSKEPYKSSGVTSITRDVGNYTIDIDKFTIGDITKTDIKFNVIDLLNLNNMLSSYYVDVIDGIMGNDMIFSTIDKIDISGGLVVLKEQD